jgi:uncharacterized SAM-binding protein YcdF (DUF218 family)
VSHLVRFFLELPVLLWLLAALALAGLWLRPARRRLIVLTACLVLLAAYSMPATGYLLNKPLEDRHPPLGRRPEGIEAIVVLGGGIQAPEADGLPSLPAADTLYRCLRASHMYRQGPPCPVLVCGGKEDAGSTEPPCARVMRDFLAGQGVAAADLVEEDASASTYENAVEAARLLGQRGLRRVLLVTDAAHMDRAVRCFAKQGVDAVACGCNYRTLKADLSWHDFLPNPAGARGVRSALHEWLGLAGYSLRGWI